MKKINVAYRLLGLLALLSVVSCTDLAHVHRFAESGRKEMATGNALAYNFSQACLDRCKLNAMRTFDIKREESCNCKLYEDADAVTHKIERALAKYFTALSRLSNDELTNYNVDPLADALAEGQFGSVTIEKKQAEAYTSIAQILLKATTDAYRRKKSRDYIAAGNEPVQVLLTKLQFILNSNLATEIDFKKESLYTYYNELKQSRKLSDYERGEAVKTYYDQLNQASRQKTAILKYSRALEKTAAAHQQLYINRDKLSVAQIRSLLQEYTDEINGIMEGLQQLKN